MKKCQILIVEDDLSSRQFLSDGLREDYGQEVLDFTGLNDLKEALEDAEISKRIKKDLPLIMILDIMLPYDNASRDSSFTEKEGDSDKEPHSSYQWMPNRSIDDVLGLEIGKMIREGAFKGIPSSTPIVFFTARQSMEIREDIKKMGKTTMICKPAFLDEIHQAIQSLLDAE